MNTTLPTALRHGLLFPASLLPDGNQKANLGRAGPPVHGDPSCITQTLVTVAGGGKGCHGHRRGRGQVSYSFQQMSKAGVRGGSGGWLTVATGTALSIGGAAGRPSSLPRGIVGAGP